MVEGPRMNIHEPKLIWNFDRDEPIEGSVAGRSLMIVAVIFAAMVVSCWGCIRPTNAELIPTEDEVTEPTKPIEPTPDPIGNDKEIGSPNVSLAVGLPPQLWELVAEHFSDNSVTIEKPITIERDGLTVKSPAGLKAKITVANDKADVSFSEPFPTVAKWKFWSKLHGLTLKPDGSGIAATGVGEWKFRWADDEANGKADIPPPPTIDLAKPIIIAWSMPKEFPCPPCDKAKKELPELAEFVVLWDVCDPPEWVGGRPFFWWHPSGRDPRNEKVRETIKLEGYTSKADMLSRWKNSRVNSSKSESKLEKIDQPNSLGLFWFRAGLVK